MRIDFIILFIISLIIMIYAIVRVAKSSLDIDKKLLLYVLCIFVPPAGLIFFFIVERMNRNN